MVGDFAAHGIGSLMFLAAVLNVNLGLINLLPIPILDGGWLLILIVEALGGRPLKDEHHFCPVCRTGTSADVVILATHSDLADYSHRGWARAEKPKRLKLAV